MKHIEYLEQKIIWQSGSQMLAKFQEKFLVDPDNAPAEQLRSFLHEHFKILEKGLHNTYHRKVYEGIFITINKPGINKQTEHNSSKILCRCIVPREK